MKNNNSLGRVIVWSVTTAAILVSALGLKTVQGANSPEAVGQGGAVVSGRQAVDRGAIRSMPGSGAAIGASNQPMWRPIMVRTAEMDINYQVSTAPQQLDRIELWYRRGRQGAWEFYGFDEDRVSPVQFTAPVEGEIGFLIVAVDRWGRASYGNSQTESLSRVSIPSEVVPHLVVFVDYTRPQLYLNVVHAEELGGGQKQLFKISWNGFDANLGQRPVRLFYGPAEGDLWNPIGGAWEAMGEYQWSMPAGLAGMVQVKAMLTDLAGNSDIRQFGPFNVVPGTTNDVGRSGSAGIMAEQYPSIATTDETASGIGAGAGAVSKAAGIGGVEMAVAPASGSPSGPGQAEGDPSLRQSGGVVPVTAISTADGADDKGRSKAKQYYRSGELHLQRFEYAKAAQAFEKALDHDPHDVQTRLELAQALYWMCQFDQAQKHLEQCMRDRPNHKSALFQLAQTHVALRHYDQALSCLNNYLELDRRDWHAWLLRGDVAEKMGRRSVALRSWRQAANDRSPVKRRARELLDKYQP